MRLKHYLYIVPLAFLTACSNSEERTPTDDHPNGQIQLSAGIVEGGQNAVTRAGAEDNHANHLTLTNGTKLALQVSGVWTGHGTGTVVQTTTATVGAETSEGSKHNALTCSPVLYWDDYGTADPANATTGRTTGLTIYGAAINGKTTAPTVGDYTALSWTLAANQTASGETPADKDLLISNNVQASPGVSTSNDGTYKFTERASGKLLEFRHALSKITVNLKAGEGFDGNVFASDPEVKLTSNEANSSAYTEWPIITGKVNVTTGVVDITSDGQGTHSVITMNQTTATTGYNVTKEALVIPGSEFASDAAIIARINADGNIYYVTAEKIRTAINSSTHATDGAYATEAGKNYIINVTVNKTAINVTATVTDWTTVTAAEVAPKININVSFGNPENIRYDQFSFYRSLSPGGNINDGYSFGDDANLVANGFYKPESRITHDYSGNTWTWDPQRYWSDHNTHYQFRLVWPRATTDTKAADPNHPHVERKTYDGGTSYQQVIEIKNVSYEPLQIVGEHVADDNTHHPYPSNLMIARPEIDPTVQCTNNEPGHTRTYLYGGGICATEGNINLTFRYVMSQVEVNLTTTNTTSAVELANAVVEIVNVYRSGDVKLGDREVIQTGDKGSYILDAVAGAGNENKRLSAIVPQVLTFTEALASTNVRFRVTITNTHGTVDTSDDTQDVYYADVEPILESGKSTKVAPNGKWESGYHYVYNLNVSKTAIKATATLAEWTTVEANENVWF